MTDQKNSNGAAIGAGIAGAVVGAGVAVAATAILSDEKKREQVKNTLSNVKDKVMEGVNHIEGNVEDAKKSATNGIDKAKTTAEEAKSAVSNQAH